MIIKPSLKLIILIIFTLIYFYSYKEIKLLNKYHYNYPSIKNIKIKINIAIFSQSLSNGGIERQTSLMLKYFNKIKIFKLFLFTIKGKEENEYKIEPNIKRIRIKKDLIYILKKKKINIFIYQSYNDVEINQLNNLNQTKTIIINHSCFLHWIYYKYYFYFKTVYKAYKNCKYLVSLIPFENYYLFKKWGINSILMNNFVPYEFELIIPSDLSAKIILMIGRGDDPVKRFELGIRAMKYISQKVPDSEMKIISRTNNIDFLKKLVLKLKLKNCVKFMGFSSNPEIYYKNASLHIFPTLVEAFPNILSETLIYGIPNILTGLDYVSASKGGTVIIYDDSPISISKIAIKILNNERYRKKLGKKARENIKRFRNDILLEKWVKIIISIYNGDNYFKELRIKDKNFNKNEYKQIINNQIKLLKMRDKKFENITINDIKNFSFMENIK